MTKLYLALVACVLAFIAAAQDNAALLKEARRNPEIYLQLAEEALNAYNLDESQDYLNSYAAAIKKSRKDPVPEYEYLNNSLLNIRNMLDRVERITVIDSLTVPFDDFFRFYRLSKDAGVLTTADKLPKGVKASADMPIYASHDGQSVLWSVPDSAENDRLMEGTVLLDGTLDSPHAIDMGLEADANVDYPWLMPDGTTLYFAYDGPGSIGGYDIFMTRRDGEGGWYAPQNMGMPYNSPYDDYMLAIDEGTGLGWWATDRNAPDSLVTIYIFKPNDVRTNYPQDAPNLASLALLSSIADTQSGADVAALKQRLLNIDNLSSSLSPDYDDQDTSYTPQWIEYRRALEAYNARERHLVLLRQQYGRGNKGVGPTILDLETSLIHEKEQLKNLHNLAIQSSR